MCRQISADFPPGADTPRAARRFLVGVCRRWEVAEPVERLELVLSELVTNAVLHAGGPVSVTVMVNDGMVEVAVTDTDPRPPVLRPNRHNLLADLDLVDLRQAPHGFDERHQSLLIGPSGSVAAGRGLLIVDSIAAEWGVSGRPEGKAVWARVPLGHWRYAPHCTCRSGPRQSTSGRPLTHIAGPWDTDSADAPAH